MIERADKYYRFVGQRNRSGKENAIFHCHEKVKAQDHENTRLELTLKFRLVRGVPQYLSTVRPTRHPDKHLQSSIIILQHDGFRLSCSAAV